jgi:glycosyltransferase involved in cell wall biosynthesis
VTLLIDPRLEDLPEHLTGRCEQVTRVTPDRAEEFALLVQTSPMTHDPTPLLHVLLGSAESLAIVYDFIPMHHPEVYLKFVGERAEYARNLEALRCYREFLCISQTVRNELVEHLGKKVGQRSTVAWPLSISQSMKKQIAPKLAASTQGPVVVMTGDDARKNTFGGLAGIAAATSAHESRDVVVLGMNTGDDRVHHWSIAAAMRPGEALDSPHLTDNELTDLLAQAPCVVVPSFDEGLSLPVIEALVCGTPVVSSDIPAHRELLGDGKFMFDPTSPESIANAFEWVGKNPEVALRQRQTLLAHDHEDLEEQVSSVIGPFVNQIAEETEFLAESPIRVVDRELKVAVATPWPPQASGVADYSAATIRELAQLCDVTLFTTSGATVDHTGLDRMIKHARPVDEFLASPEEVADEFDCVIAVIGNSHFHTPFIELLTSTDCLVIAHDTRMTEYYLALRDRGGLGQLMLRTQDPQASTSLRPGLDDQVEDLRLLQNAGMWEIARQACSLIMHSVISQPLVKKQTGVSAHVLPFAHYRVAKPSLVDDAARRDARVRLGMHSDDSTLHLGTFGYVDIRTKQVDLVLEAAGWLTMWGHRIALHVVGSADDTTRGMLESRARALGLHQFEITGYQSEEMYQDWLRAIDLGIQLRISPFLGVSGPLADMAAFGVRAVASEGLCTDIGAPDFIDRLPDSISSTGLADAIEAAVTDSRSSDEREESRVGYIDSHSPKEYARALYDHILEVIV